MLRLSPFLFYTLSIAAAFSGTAVNHVLAAALSSVPTKSAFHKLSFFLVVKDASMSGVLNLIRFAFYLFQLTKLVIINNHAAIVVGA